MAVLPIVKYGNDVLRRPTELVDGIDGELQKLIDDMVDTMHAAPGIGLPRIRSASPGGWR